MGQGAHGLLIGFFTQRVQFDLALGKAIGGSQVAGGQMPASQGMERRHHLVVQHFAFEQQPLFQRWALLDKQAFQQWAAIEIDRLGQPVHTGLTLVRVAMVMAFTGGDQPGEVGRIHPLIGGPVKLDGGRGNQEKVAFLHPFGR